MPSLIARLSAAYTRAVVKPALGDLSDLARVRRVFGARLPMGGGVRIEPGELGGIRGEWVRPMAAGAVLGRLLYLHGGGFVGCSPRTHRPITAAFARRGWEVFVPDYRLAPEHPHPAALEDCVAAWRAMAGSAGRVTVAGDSAGGQLALALMLHERDAGRAMPQAAALLSPATDLSGGSASITENATRDAMFHGPGLAHLAQAYLQGADPTQASASPLLADLSGLPPLIIHAGTDEALRDDATRLAAKAREAGVRVQLQLWPGVMHVWQLVRFMPEARRSIALMSDFLCAAEPITAEAPEAVDVLIIGAGLSGIGAAAALQDHEPHRSVAILEARNALGGTWDLFRYPGVRADSDRYTLGYAFRPWVHSATLADGPSILKYLQDTARERGLQGLIRYGHRVVAADWDSGRAHWRVTVEREGAEPKRRVIHARMVNACAGYYRYDRGHRPSWPGEAAFSGRWVHPQFWPQDLSVQGQRIVVIGSGATAVTLVPELARTAAQVTLLQRSPSHVMTLPSRDRVAEGLQRVLPQRWAWKLLRGRNILLGQLFYDLCRRYPRLLGRLLVKQARRQAGRQTDPKAFEPRYAPWDERLCIVPDGDLFQSLRAGRAAVVTGEIAGFGPQSVRLADGREIGADILVTATGLELQLLGGAALSVDGRPVDPAHSLAYKGVMFSGVPNLIATFGYPHASWTLKADLTARWACRLLDHLDRMGCAAAVPVADPDLTRQPFLTLQSGYVRRSQDRLPAQGDRPPWQVHANHLRNVWMLRWAPMADRQLRLLRAKDPPVATLAG